MAGPAGIDFKKLWSEEVEAEARRRHELRHLRRIRIVLLVLLSPVWLPFYAFVIAIASLSALFEFLKDGPS